MDLTQLTTLRDDIVSKSNFVYEGKTFDQLLGESRHDVIAKYYNERAVPNQNIWRTDLPVAEMICEVTMADFIQLPQAQREAFNIICMSGSLNMSKARLRNSIQSCLGAGTTSYNDVISVSRKKATNFEFLYTTGNVSELYGYILQPDEIVAAMRI